MPLMRPKVLLPVAIVAVTAAVVFVIHATRPDLEPRPPEDRAPLVRVLRVDPGDFQFHVIAQGSVAPRREGDLVPQVEGEVVWVSPHLVAGGFFEKGDPLVRIDRADYEASLESARASVARAESEFRRAEKELARQRRLADRSVASEARIDDAENAHRVAQAVLREGRAQLERAERDLARTELQAPYKGRVRDEQVDLGQFVGRGAPIATLYAVDYAEVRLPLPDRELAYLDLVLRARSRDENGAAQDPASLGPRAELRADFAGRTHSWQGYVVRTEGELDPKSRMVHVVVRVEDPYDTRHESPPGRPPLAVGLFVEADIEGVVAEDVYVLPRSALRRNRGEDEPRFARFEQQPGDLDRPNPLCDSIKLRPHGQGLVRVLDDEGNAVGAWNPGLQPAVLRKGLEWMLTVRAMDGRLLKMQRQGRLSFYLECRGEEAVAIAAAMAFGEGDILFPAYRQQGIFLVRGMPMLDMMCQCIGNRRDITKGRQMPVHYSWKTGNVVSISSPVGTQFPQAVGAAMAAAYQRKPQAAAAWMGDGTTAQGDFHYALNFASVYRPPVILNVVDNQWAISTHRNLATGGTDIRRACRQLCPARYSRGRKRLPCGIRGHILGRRTCPTRRRSHVDRAVDLSHSGSLHE